MTVLIILILTALGTLLGGLALAYLLDQPSGLRGRANRAIVATVLRAWETLSNPKDSVVGLLRLLGATLGGIAAFGKDLADKIVVRRKRETRQEAIQLAWCKLGNLRSESGRNGLEFFPYPGDGQVPRVVVGREYVRRTDNASGHHYIYVRFREDVAEHFRKRPVIIIVEYLDRDEGRNNSTRDEGKRGFTISYDSAGGESPRHRFKRTRRAPLAGSGEWLLAGVEVRDGDFRRRANGGDLRIATSYPSTERDYDVFVRRVFAVPLD